MTRKEIIDALTNEQESHNKLEHFCDTLSDCIELLEKGVKALTCRHLFSDAKLACETSAEKYTEYLMHVERKEAYSVALFWLNQLSGE